MTGGGRIAAALLLALSYPLTVWAQSFSVTAEIVEGCALAGATQTSGLDFGTLNFGTYPAVHTGTLTASSVGAGGSVQVECTAGLTMQISVDGGQHLNGGTRRLGLSGGGGSYVPYSLFTTPANNVAVPIGSPASIVIPPAGVVDIPIYGLLTLSGAGLMPGTYEDVLQVTLSW